MPFTKNVLDLVSGTIDKIRCYKITCIKIRCADDYNMKKMSFVYVIHIAHGHCDRILGYWAVAWHTTGTQIP